MSPGTSVRTLQTDLILGNNICSGATSGRRLVLLQALHEVEQDNANLLPLHPQREPSSN